MWITSLRAFARPLSSNVSLSARAPPSRCSISRNALSQILLDATWEPSWLDALRTLDADGYLPCSLSDFVPELIKSFRWVRAFRGREKTIRVLYEAYPSSDPDVREGAFSLASRDLTTLPLTQLSLVLTNDLICTQS